MISILIPTYNYDASPLVHKLKQLADGMAIQYEIIVSDDGSVDKLKENQSIDEIEECTFLNNDENLGRAGNINRLVKNAKYRYCLLLDCDVSPVSPDFLSKYINMLQPEQICFGGITYNKEKPTTGILRWKYGRYQEARSVDERKRSPYRFLLTSNLLFDKRSIGKKLFDDRIKTYGYEDLLLAQYLKRERIPVHHIDNAVVHENLETSSIYLEKTKTALTNLARIVKEDLIDKDLTGISKWGEISKKLGLSGIFLFFYKRWKARMEEQFLGKDPHLMLFKIYKLGFYLERY